MAIVRKMIFTNLEKDSVHTEVECTYSIPKDPDGNKYLQIDTYGSKDRKIPGKKSQSIRLTEEAILQLKRILADQF